MDRPKGQDELNCRALHRVYVARYQGDREGRLYHVNIPYEYFFIADRNQGDREGRPYNTTEHLAKRVYCTGDPRGRPGSALNALIAPFS